MKGRSSKAKSPGGRERRISPHTLLWKFEDKAEQSGLGDFTMDCKALMCEGSNQMLQQEVAFLLILGPATTPAGLILLTNSRPYPKLSVPID